VPLLLVLLLQQPEPVMAVANLFLLIPLQAAYGSDHRHLSKGLCAAPATAASAAATAAAAAFLRF
jgi:hypothetical protein